MRDPTVDEWKALGILRDHYEGVGKPSVISLHVRIQRLGGGDRGSRPPHPPPLKNHKNIGFLSNIGPDPLKITKLPSQHTTVGHYQPARETPFKWRFAGEPMMTGLY